MTGLLTPGATRAAGVADDAAFVTAVIEVEIAWLRVLADKGAVEADKIDAAVAEIRSWTADLTSLRDRAEAAGNPIVPLVADLRAAVSDKRVSALLHRGLTSQDVLDTALVLLAKSALRRIEQDLATAARELARLVATHRETIMAGRTLTQHAVPITFGLKAAQWLSGVLAAADRVRSAGTQLPVQCGGAAGTLSLASELTSDPIGAASELAEGLDLMWPGLPWHTTRFPMTRLGDTLLEACDALGVIATDVVTLARPEIAELREGAAPGRGGSSTMPHKRNPVLSVLVRAAAMQAPLLGAQLHLAAAQAVDERPDGAWHTEWPTLGRLLELTVTAASQTAELVSGLEVDVERMRSRVSAAATDLLAERRGEAGNPGGGQGEPADYLGATAEFITVVLTRYSDSRP